MNGHAMHRTTPSALLALLLCAAPTFAAAPPQEFGSDWDDPRTAAPLVERPPGKACSVEIVDHGFTSFDPYQSSITPPADCPGPWSKIVLDVDGSVKGRQYDRISHIEIAGITVLRTSTPEPSRDGISWHVEKDISGYASLFTGTQPVAMYLGNVINDTYTGVFQIKARVTFYQADAQHAGIDAADRISLPQDMKHDGPDITGTFALPANTRRLVAEVYATGSGGGCEEFWYFTTPKEAKYSCPSGQGPYREVQVLLDGRVAGIAMPYPHIYTGGWSNPFLWYVLPAPRTFDIRPINYDLTPFIGVLNDGKPHDLRVRVLGVARDSEGWKLLPSLQVWLDDSAKPTRGRLLDYQLDELALSHPVSTDASSNTAVSTHGQHRLKVRGELQTSGGRIDTTIEYLVANRNDHRWDKAESQDALDIEWTETVNTTVKHTHRAAVRTTARKRYTIKGEIRTEAVATEAAAGKQSSPPQRLTTEIRVDDEAEWRRHQRGDVVASSETRDHFEGSASYTTGVPREKRNAVGHSTQHYSQRDSEGRCYERTIAQRNGALIEDRSGCL
jgi:Peptide N-acetyl-beta-D-glucosaminyl asparaginase amidase A